MHADRTNRAATILLALLLLIGGVGLALLSFGVFGSDSADRPISDNLIWEYVGEQGHWIWPVTAVVCVIVVLLCLRWIVVLLASTDRVNELTVRGDRSHGRTMLSSSAVTTAVTDEISGYPGVESTSARMIGDDVRPELVLQVQLDQSADIAEVRTLIDNEAIPHVRQATDDPHLPVTVELGMTAESGARVR